MTEPTLPWPIQTDPDWAVLVAEQAARGRYLHIDDEDGFMYLRAGADATGPILLFTPMGYVDDGDPPAAQVALVRSWIAQAIPADRRPQTRAEAARWAWYCWLPPSRRWFDPTTTQGSAP